MQVFLPEHENVMLDLETFHLLTETVRGCLLSEMFHYNHQRLGCDSVNGSLC